MEKILLKKGNQEIEVVFDGDDIKIELKKGFPPGMSSERVVDTVMREFAIKEKVGHKPHIHTPEGQVIYTG
ncbi:hypothetical protein CMI37_06070 [Candidatus Pacearchaeota archaeon]|nr:hypothetical protein [Candidatus Pacearchaeota archaeon]|tara:strand:- start:766 stop:978 length:213 start_codon:yes stop_codon:yes gene_type:complete